MIKYITKEEFKELILQLPETKTLDLSIEDSWEGNEYIWKFAYVDFNGGTYLYAGNYPEVGVIQDTYISSFDESLDDIWEEMTENDDKPFIMAD